MGKRISETKCTCSSCDNVWHYGKTEALEGCGGDMQNCGKSLMCCGGCFPAIFIPDKKTADYGKCPKCGSKAFKKEIVTHEVN
jgi:hypothetical protein